MGTKTNTNSKKKPSYAAQRLVDQGTEANAAGHTNKAQVIFLVKGDQEHPDSFFSSDLPDKGHTTKDDINSHPWHISGKVGLGTAVCVQHKNEAQWVCGRRGPVGLWGSQARGRGGVHSTHMVACHGFKLFYVV